MYTCTPRSSAHIHNHERSWYTRVPVCARMHAYLDRKREASWHGLCISSHKPGEKTPRLDRYKIRRSKGYA